MHDLVIRGANIADGTGEPCHIADVAVDDGLFSEVGQGLGKGKREIDGSGLLLTPGWVDIHTHYDGQATWDPYLTPSSWHGVTTAVFGNCSVGFAPVRPGSEPYLINLMEGVEDIPETVLAEGINFTWESFPQYLDALETTPRIMDIGAQVPHAALRYYVMGQRGADHQEKPTSAEVDSMGELLEQSLQAGALGFTTARTTKHKAADGRFTPGLTAEDAELAGLARAMRRAGSGVIEVNSDFGPGEFEKMRAAAELAGRPLSVLLVQVDKAPGLWRETLDAVGDACRDGLEFSAQIGCRPIGVLMSLESTVHPFTTHPAWLALADMTPAARLARICEDSELRRQMVDDLPDDEHTRFIRAALERTFELKAPVDYEPLAQNSVAAQAKSKNLDPVEMALELMCQNEGRGLLLHPFENYNSGDLETVREMLLDENTVCGVADAGAHVGLICDASSPTYLLTHWARDRTRGEQLPLEFLVRKQTMDTARTYGLNDRGIVAPGYKADFNLIDMKSLNLLAPELVYDLPAGGRRFVQKATGYRHTFVSGIEVMRDGEFTGELPGKLLRGSQLTPGQAAE
ncbi:MAG: amidohydrolase family protein [Alphaproteobacteria bacterium]|jgi:N-acyl-D-aspartate/D-glutamate deacylase|nr:amidohydrolase family protein [Alphaproteobacteria bacterium]MBT4018480.1 amidohydrolase family protein [Alphaproteobacteria bacterium]MBT5916967.1 amidohydrolase family protein [Alphaproteobacteria bacterium]MBT6386061.1 amidohydrolase family protein [Alphaproteobacteria bacterium]